MSKWVKESCLPKPPEIEMLLVFYPGRPVKVNGSNFKVVEITLDNNVWCASDYYSPSTSPIIFYPQFIEVSDDDGATWYAPFAPKEVV